MYSAAEAERLDVSAGDVERVGILVASRIVVGGTEYHRYDFSLRNRHAIDLDVGLGDAIGELHGAIVAKQLLGEVAVKRWIRAEDAHLIRVLKQREETVSDQVRGGLEARGEEQRSEGGELVVGERVFTVCPQGEAAQKVVRRPLSFLRDQTREVGAARQHRRVGGRELGRRRP